jgi:hypothetical protein
MEHDNWHSRLSGRCLVTVSARLLCLLMLLPCDHDCTDPHLYELFQLHENHRLMERRWNRTYQSFVNAQDWLLLTYVAKPKSWRSSVFSIEFQYNQIASALIIVLRQCPRCRPKMSARVSGIFKTHWKSYNVLEIWTQLFRSLRQ